MTRRAEPLPTHRLVAIERVLASHPDVDPAYLVGAPEARTGEAAHAFVVGDEGRKPDLDALRVLVADEFGTAFHQAQQAQVVDCINSGRSLPLRPSAACRSL